MPLGHSLTHTLLAYITLLIYGVIDRCEIKIIISGVVESAFSAHAVSGVGDMSKFLPIKHHAGCNEHGDSKQGSDDSAEDVSHGPLPKRDRQITD